MMIELQKLIDELKEDRDIARAEMIDNFKKSEKMYNYFLGKETAISLIVQKLSLLLNTEKANSGNAM